MESWRDPQTYDVVVVGGGAAGLNAALVLGRARRRVAVVDAGAPRNAPAAQMHGFLSRDGTPPAGLLAAGRVEVAGYGVELLEGRVEHIDPGGQPGFLVPLAAGPVLAARRVLVATGLRDELPELPGVPERWGKDLLHCPYCHGYEVRDQPLGVLGTGPRSVDQALLVRQWSADVVFFPHTVELAGGQVVLRRAVFVVPRMLPHDGLLTGLGCTKDGDGWVITDASGRTSVPRGVWAAGNVADPRAQVVTAAGVGSAAAIAINHDLFRAATPGGRRA
jgi:thioredoxin reductase